MTPESPFPPGAQVSAYLRDSGGNTQDLSVPQQEAAIRDYCQQHDLILAHVYKDTARSGGTTVGRDQFDAMIKAFFDAETSDAGIIFWQYSRFARNLDTSQYYLAGLRMKGFQVYSLEDRLPSGAAGRLMELVTLWKDDEFRKELGRNVQRGQRYIATIHHGLPSRRVPAGYQLNLVEIGTRRDGKPHHANQLVPGPDADRVRQAWAMRRAGHSLGEIHAETRLFRAVQSYNKFFRNPIYTGVLQWGDLLIEGFCEPLIDRTTWEVVQQINLDSAARGTFRHPRRVNSKFVLAGLLHCGLCGALMIGSTVTRPNGKIHEYYHCLKSHNTVRLCTGYRVRKVDIEQLVYDRLKEHVFAPEVIQEVYAAAKDEMARQSSTQADRLNTLRIDLGRANGAIERLVSAITEAGHSRAMLERLAALEKERGELAAQIVQLEEQTRAVLPEMDASDLAALAAGAVRVIDHGEDRERQLLIRSFVRAVYAAKTAEGITGRIVFVPPAPIGGSERECNL